jgi:hypothetical protein
MARRNGVRDYTEIPERGGNPNELVNRIYDDGRAVGFPRNKPPSIRREPADNSAVERQGRVDPWRRDEIFNENTNQHPANWKDKAYDNDVPLDSWLRNGDATSKPGFDKHDNAWRSDSKGNAFGRETIKDFEADHNRHWTEFEHKHNAGTTHTTEGHDYSKRHVPQYERRGELGLDRPKSEPKPRR